MEFLEFLKTPLGSGLLFAALTVWPLARIVARAGHPPPVALLVFVPLVGLVLVLAFLTFRPWPALALATDVDAGTRKERG